MKLCGQVGCVTRMNRFDFGEDLDLDIGIKKNYFIDSSSLSDGTKNGV